MREEGERGEMSSLSLTQSKHSASLAPVKTEMRRDGEIHQVSKKFGLLTGFGYNLIQNFGV